MASIQAISLNSSITDWSIPKFAQNNFDSAPTNRDWYELAELMTTHKIRSIKQLVRQFRIISADLNRKAVDYTDLQAQHHVYIEKCVNYDRQVDELRAENERTKENARSVIDENNGKLNEIQNKYDSLLGQIEVLKKSKVKMRENIAKKEDGQRKKEMEIMKQDLRKTSKELDELKKMDNGYIDENAEACIKPKHPIPQKTINNDYCTDSIDDRVRIHCHDYKKMQKNIAKNEDQQRKKEMEIMKQELRKKSKELKTINNENFIDLIDNRVRIDGRDLSITRNFISVETRKRKIQQSTTSFKTRKESRKRDHNQHRGQHDKHNRHEINESFRESRKFNDSSESLLTQARDGSDYRRYCND